MSHYSYWQIVWEQFKKRKLGLVALYIAIFLSLVGIYAPFLASSQPLFVIYQKVPYFPLFRYLFSSVFYTKGLDLCFNLGMFSLPLILILRKRRLIWPLVLASHAALFIYLILFPVRDPASDPILAKLKQQKVSSGATWGWQEELSMMNAYKQLEELVEYRLDKAHHEKLVRYTGTEDISTLWKLKHANREERLEALTSSIEAGKESYEKALAESSQTDQDVWVIKAFEQQLTRKRFIEEREEWLETESAKLSFMIMPLLRNFHWEDDAGGDQKLNRRVPWWELSRMNRKDLVAGLIFGVRISLVVGVTAIGLATMIGVPIGGFAGYFGGRFDIIASRLIEIWESMPAFFMLLMVVAVTQSKSIFLVIAVIGIFGWTGFSRYARAEFFKQRNLPYVEACHSLGFGSMRIIFRHILPNAVPPLITLLPFSMMGAITSEAGLSFLGLGEEGSCSWGVLMDEGRHAFPGESYLLWPPAIILTCFLVAIALIGDTLRDAVDPKMRR